MAKLDDATRAYARETPCGGPADLYAPRARRLIGELCRTFLDPIFTTPIELLYLRRHQTRLMDKPGILQHAVQQIAIAQIQGTAKPVTDRMRELMEIVDAGVKATIVRNDAYECPTVTAKDFGAVAARIRSETSPTDSVFHIYAALAGYLADADSWRVKFDRLAALFGGGPDAEDIKFLDIILSELMTSSPAIRDLFGEADSLYHRMFDLIDLFRGEYPASDQAEPSATAKAVNAIMAKHDMPKTRAALSRQVLLNVAGTAHLTPGPALNELNSTRLLFHKLRDHDKPMGGDRLEQVIAKRMSRQMNHDQIARVLDGKKTPEQQIPILLTLHDTVMGSDNIKFIHDKIRYIVDNREFEHEYAASDSGIRAVKALGRLHKAFRKSTMSGTRESHFTERLAKLQAKLLREQSVFARLDKMGKTVPEKASNLIELCEAGAFCEGDNLDAARKLISHYLAQPNFKAALLAGAGDGEGVLQTFMGRLRSVGIDAALVS